MRGCARCGHLKREHMVPGRDIDTLLCVHVVGGRACLCPKYIKP